MAVVNTVATTITDEVKAEPWRVASSAAEVLYETSGIVSVAAADDDTSTYRFARLPGNARVVSIRVYCAAITAGTSFDFGLFDAGSTVKAVHAFATAVDLSSAQNGTDITYQSKSIANHRKKVWEDAGDSADPGTQYDLVATANTVGSATVSVLVVCTYVLTP